MSSPSSSPCTSSGPSQISSFLHHRSTNSGFSEPQIPRHRGLESLRCLSWQGFRAHAQKRRIPVNFGTWVPNTPLGTCRQLAVVHALRLEGSDGVRRYELRRTCMNTETDHHNDEGAGGHPLWLQPLAEGHRLAARSEGTAHHVLILF